MSKQIVVITSLLLLGAIVIINIYGPRSTVDSTPRPLNTSGEYEWIDITVNDVKNTSASEASVFLPRTKELNVTVQIRPHNGPAPAQAGIVKLRQKKVIVQSTSYTGVTVENGIAKIPIRLKIPAETELGEATLTIQAPNAGIIANIPVIIK